MSHERSAVSHLDSSLRIAHGSLLTVVQCSHDRRDLLEILVCPADKQPLEYRQNPESLKCTQCHRVYLVKDDIPIMLIDEAKIEA